MTNLQTAIVLSKRCVDDVDRVLNRGGAPGERMELLDRWLKRDDLVASLPADDLKVFRDWANGRMTDAEVEAVLATDEAS